MNSNDHQVMPSLTRKEKLILDLLLGGESSELFGLEMLAKAEGSLKRGTVYVTLQRMEEKGLIESRLEPRTSPEIGIPRRLYRATGLGERTWTAHCAFQRYLSVPLLAN